MKRILVTLTILLLIQGWHSERVYAQRALEKFGKNRIQHDQFEWRYIESDNFDVYFYSGGEKIAKDITLYLESQFERITDMIGYPPYAKTKVFFYNSIDDLEQSNVGLNQTSLSSNGETKFVKSNIEVANPGSISKLKQELLYKVSGSIVNEMMYGGNLKDMFQSAVLLNLPDWFIDGAAMYVSKGWSIEMDNYMRDLFKKRKPKKLNRLKGDEALLAGQSVWNFIAEKYGRGAIANILNYTRIIRNEEKSVTITLGISFDQLMQEWLLFYQENQRPIDANYVLPSEDAQLTSNHRDFDLNHAVLNSDGTRLAYIKNNKGIFEVVIRNLQNGKEESVLKSGFKVVNQQVDLTMPVLDWADSTRLGIVHNKGNRLTFTLYDVLSKSKLPRRLDRFDQINSLSFSDNGRLFVVSAVVDGESDLYLLSSLRDRTKRLTHDLYDDITPAFLPNSNTIVFSSNRISDTLNVDVESFQDVTDNYNIFLYNLDTTTNVVSRITNTISQDTHPIAVDDNNILYVSDQKGIRNLFNYEMKTGIYTQVSNFSTNLNSYDYNRSTRSLAFILADDNQDEIYMERPFDTGKQIFTPQTRRQQLLQARDFQEKRLQKSNEGKTIEDIIRQKLNDDKGEVKDTIPASEEKKQKEGIINTDDYKFENTTEDQPTTADNFLAQYRQQRTKSSIEGPFPYQSRFSADNIVTSFVIDPIRNFGVLLETDMADMLQNHKFSGGVMITSDLRSGDIYGEYEYLKELLDYNMGFERNVLFWDRGTNNNKYSKNSIHVGVSYPFSPRTRLSIQPFYTFTTFNNLEALNSPPEFEEASTNHYLGGKFELVFDNSIINGMNLIEGSRAKVGYIHYEGVNSKEISFDHFYVDLRHYQKIYKQIVFAMRGYYGSFFGNAPKQYLLGGMDNWIVSETNTRGNNNPLDPGIERDNSDLLFAQFATNLRGFDYATLVGQNTLLFNAELRIPLIRTIQNGPIASNFFKNLQFIGFFDIGSAWTGVSPFNSDNKISTVVIPPDPDDRDLSSFVIELKNFRNPWLYSYGVGMRTTMLGYYVKFDVAWPVEDYEVGSMKFMATLGFDF